MAYIFISYYDTGIYLNTHKHIHICMINLRIYIYTISYRETVKLEGSKTFEWLKGWDFYKSALSPLLSPHSRILHLGCGNSALSPDMYKDGYIHQTNMDYSQSVITTMSEMYTDLPEISWVVGDIFEMSRALFGDGPCFDVVIDKGTMDAWLTGWTDEDPWAPSEACLQKAREYVSEVEKVLIQHPDSKFIQM